MLEVPDINNYTFEIQKVNNITYEAFIITKDKVKFRTMFGCRGIPDNNLIFNLFVNRFDSFCIDVEQVNDNIDNALALQLYEEKV